MYFYSFIVIIWTFPRIIVIIPWSSSLFHASHARICTFYVALLSARFRFSDLWIFVHLLALKGVSSMIFPFLLLYIGSCTFIPSHLLLFTGKESWRQTIYRGFGLPYKQCDLRLGLSLV